MSDFECKHPDHAPNIDCRDRAVGCSPDCPCCMDITPTPERPEQEREPDTKGCSHDWHHTDCPDCGARWEATARAAGWYPPEYGYRSTSAPPAPQQEGERDELRERLDAIQAKYLPPDARNSLLQHVRYFMSHDEDCEPMGPLGCTCMMLAARDALDEVDAVLRARPAQSAPAAAPEREEIVRLVCPFPPCDFWCTAETLPHYESCPKCRGSYSFAKPSAAPPQEGAERERIAGIIADECLLSIPDDTPLALAAADRILRVLRPGAGEP